MKLRPGLEENFHAVCARVFEAQGPRATYNLTALHFALSWGRQIEDLLAAGGQPFDLTADFALEQANPQGRYEITIMQYTYAVEFLIQFWHRGEELRQWHNRKFLSIAEAARANHAGELYNPSVMQLGDKTVLIAAPLRAILDTTKKSKGGAA